MFNELRVNYQRVRDDRDGEPRISRCRRAWPAGDGSVQSGTEQSSSANELDQDIIEMTDDFTMARHAHGDARHAQRVLRVPEPLHPRELRLLHVHERRQLSRRALRRPTPTPTRTPPIRCRRPTSACASTASTPAINGARPAALTLTYGVRLDAPTFPDTPAQNPVTEQMFGYRTDVTPEEPAVVAACRLQLRPAATGRAQVRGGVGIFSGRTPYVWLSNQYGTRARVHAICCHSMPTNRIPFVADPHNQPKNVPAARVR